MTASDKRVCDSQFPGEVEQAKPLSCTGSPGARQGVRKCGGEIWGKVFSFFWQKPLLRFLLEEEVGRVDCLRIAWLK